MKKNLKILSLVIIVVVLAILCGTFLMFRGGCKEKITKRISFFDGVYDAVVTEADCGATTSVLLRVYIVENKQEIKWYHKNIFKADSVDDFDIQWKDKMLEILYSNAKIYHFSNYYPNKRSDGNVDTINISLMKR